MQLKNLVNGAEALGEIMQIKIPMVLSYKLSLFIKKINPEIEEYTKKRNELLAEHADPVLDEDKKETGQLKFKGEKAVEAFNKSINELLGQDVKIEIPEVKIEDFGDIKIEPKQLINLDWLIQQ